MADAPWDVVIVGQGLAGTTLAWQLQDAGQRVFVIDAAQEVTSSKIAAGLMTPITGKRLTVSPGIDDFMPISRQFYRRIEERLGASFFHERKALRLFRSDEERGYYERRRKQAAFSKHLLPDLPASLVPAGAIDTSGGGFAMQAAQLDVAAYLAASKQALPGQSAKLDWKRDVTIGDDEITVLGERTRRLISCEGYAAAQNPYFATVPFKPAKGDILTLRFHGPLPPLSLHRGIWLAPTKDPDVFRLGATYDWDAIDQVPSMTGRERLLRELRDVVHLRYDVLDHHAAVRPIIFQSKAVIGLHPTIKRLGYFNGLGSKGSLQAPWFAQRFTEVLVHAAPLAADINVDRYF